MIKSAERISSLFVLMTFLLSQTASAVEMAAPGTGPMPVTAGGETGSSSESPVPSGGLTDPNPLAPPTGPSAFVDTNWSTSISDASGKKHVFSGTKTTEYDPISQETKITYQGKLNESKLAGMTYHTNTSLGDIQVTGETGFTGSLLLVKVSRPASSKPGYSTVSYYGSYNIAENEHYYSALNASVLIKYTTDRKYESDSKQRTVPTTQVDSTLAVFKLIGKFFHRYESVQYSNAAGEKYTRNLSYTDDKGYLKGKEIFRMSKISDVKTFTYVNKIRKVKTITGSLENKVLNKTTVRGTYDTAKNIMGFGLIRLVGKTISKNMTTGAITAAQDVDATWAEKLKKWSGTQTGFVDLPAAIMEFRIRLLG